MILDFSGIVKQVNGGVYLLLNTMATRNLFWVGGTDNWNGTAGTKWANASGGTGGEAEPDADDNVFFDANSGAVTVTVATSVRPCLSIDFTGFTGTFAGSLGLQVNANVILDPGATYTHTGTINCLTTGASTFTSNGASITSPVAINGSGGTITFQDNLNTTGRLTLTQGTFDFNSFDITAGGFTSTSNANVKVLTPNGGSLYITGTGTWVTSGTQTNLTLNTSGMNIYCTGSAADMRTSNSQSVLANVFFQGSGTATFGLGSGVWGNVEVSGATITTFTVSANVQLNNLDFTGFTGDFNGSTAFRMAGDLVMTSSMTTTNTGTITNNKNGAITLNTANVSMDCGYTISGGASCAVTLGSSFKLTAARTLTLFNSGNGTLDLAGYNLTCGILTSTASNTRTFTYGSGTVELTSTGTVFNVANTNLTKSANTATLKISDSSGVAKTCNSSAQGAYPENINFSGAGSFALKGSNTFTTITAGTGGTTLFFSPSTTTTVTNFNVNGTSGSKITINTDGASTDHSLVKAGGGVVDCNYLNIQHSRATPSYNTWFAGNGSINNQATPTAGYGWNFTTSTTAKGGFMPFM